MTDDLLTARVLGAVEHEDAAVLHRRRGVERGETLPMHHAVVHRREEGARASRRDHRVHGLRLLEWAKHPGLPLRASRWAREHEEQQRQPEPAAAREGDRATHYWR